MLFPETSLALSKEAGGVLGGEIKILAAELRGAQLLDELLISPEYFMIMEHKLNTCDKEGGKI